MFPVLKTWYKSLTVKTSSEQTTVVETETELIERFKKAPVEEVTEKKETTPVAVVENATAVEETETMSHVKE